MLDIHVLAHISPDTGGESSCSVHGPLEAMYIYSHMYVLSSTNICLMAVCTSMGDYDGGGGGGVGAAGVLLLQQNSFVYIQQIQAHIA